MENLGYLAILFSFCLCVYGVVAAVVGKWRHKPFLEVSAQRTVLAVWVLVTRRFDAAALRHPHQRFPAQLRGLRAATSTCRLIYKFAAWWGGQEGSLLFWSWIAATYSFVAVYTGRKQHRDMISYVVAIMLTMQGFFLGLIAFIANPFQVLMSGPQIVVRRRRQRSQSAAAAPHHGDPSADAVSGLRRLRGAVRVRDRVADHAPARGPLDPHHAPLDDGHLAVPVDRRPARRALGLRRAGLGRLLGLGPGRERLAAALDHRHRLPALGDDAGKERHDEGLEHRARVGDVFPVHLRHVPDAQRPGQLRPRFRAVADRRLFRLVSRRSASR